LYLELAKNEKILDKIDYKQIDAYLEKGLEIAPNDIEFLTEYAKLVKYDKPKKAIELYSKLIEISPNPADFYKDIAYVYKGENKNLKALEFYQKEIIANPDSHTYSQDYIVDICKELKSKDAITILEETLTHGINKNTNYVLYELYFKKENYKKALENALNYIEYSEDEANRYVKIGDDFFKKEFYKEAEQLFRKAVKSITSSYNDGKKMQCYNYIGLCNLRKEPADIDKALEALMEGFKLRPEQAVIQQNIFFSAVQIYKKEEYEKAKELFEFCIENDFSKSKRKSYILLGSIYDKQGAKKEALSCFENALALDPEDDMIAKRVERLKKAVNKKGGFLGRLFGKK